MKAHIAYFLGRYTSEMMHWQHKISDVTGAHYPGVKIELYVTKTVDGDFVTLGLGNMLKDFVITKLARVESDEEAEELIDECRAFLTAMQSDEWIDWK